MMCRPGLGEVSTMIRVRRSAERGAANHGWLETRYTFSFSDYFDPDHVQFRALRVMNEDRVAPGAGFPTHGHRDMEILTVVLSGALAHEDSLGHGEALRPGEVQSMSAGTGIRHSEFNPSDSEPVHLYQIWLLPDRPGHAPSYGQRRFDEAGRDGRWQVVASPDGRDGSLAIHQDATVHLADLGDRAELAYPLAPGRHAWLQVMKGSAVLNGERLAEGDGAAVSGEPGLEVRGEGEGGASLLLFDLA
jgi:redox-sensitive bicupin YhaK (pirin superfamily)